MTRKRRALIITATTVLLAAFGAVKVSRSLHKPPPAPRTVLTRIGPLTLTVSETGTVQPVDKVDVKSKVAGRLLSMPIVEGQRVNAGQLIATVDRSQLDPQIARTRAQLTQAQARLAQSQSEYALQVRQSAQAIAQAQAGLKSAAAHLAVAQESARPQQVAQQQQEIARAQIALDDANRTRARKLALLAKGFVSQADADSTQVAVDTATSTLTAAQQQLALLRAGARPEDVADARAQVDAARVQVTTARANAGQNTVSRSNIAQAQAAVTQSENDLAQLLVKLNDTRIVAPASGIVLKKYRQVGEIVQDATTGFSDAQSLVVTLGSRLEVQVGINEVDIPKVRAGQPVTVRVDALPGASFAGHVAEIAPASSNAFADSSSAAGGASSIAKFAVKIGLDTFDPRLKPGMTAAVEITGAARKAVVLAPLEAVPDPGASAHVTVLTPQNTKVVRAVTLGLRGETDVEITSGLAAGERLIVPPIDGSGRRKIDLGGN